MVPIFFGMVGLALWLRAWEGRLTERMLPDYVRAGWFSPPEVAALGTPRPAARGPAVGQAGRPATPGCGRCAAYQFAATRLALLRDGMQRGLDRKPADRERGRRGGAASCWTRSRRTGRSSSAGTRRRRRRSGTAQRYHLTFPDGVLRTVRRAGRAGGADAGGAAPRCPPPVADVRRPPARYPRSPAPGRRLPAALRLRPAGHGPAAPVRSPVHAPPGCGGPCATELSSGR